MKRISFISLLIFSISSLSFAGGAGKKGWGNPAAAPLYTLAAGVLSMFGPSESQLYAAVITAQQAFNTAPSQDNLRALQRAAEAYLARARRAGQADSLVARQVREILGNAEAQVAQALIAAEEVATVVDLAPVQEPEHEEVIPELSAGSAAPKLLDLNDLTVEDDF